MLNIPLLRHALIGLTAIFFASIARGDDRFIATAQESEREPLKQLRHDQVKLTGGPLGRQYEWVHAHYLSLSNDNVLKVYRQNAGLPAPGEDMGGWYDYNGFVPGHALGQWISGLSRFYNGTGDASTLQKVRDLVLEWRETLGPNNVSILRPETNLWPCYILDKHFFGLIDAATMADVSEALPMLDRVMQGALSIIPKKGHDRVGVHNLPYDEPYVMPENLFVAAQLTNNPVFTDYAQRYLINDTFFDILANNSDPFPGQHAYSHAMALSSGAMAYLVTGDTRYRNATYYGFKLLNTQQRYASGGWGPNETFVEPHSGQLCQSLSTAPASFETSCGTWASTKLARYLLRFTADPVSTEHGDYLERVVFNGIMAEIQPDSTGDYFYYSNYTPRAEKVWYPTKWPCDSGTLAQTVADYPVNVAFGNDTALFVNFYTPSIIHYSVNGDSIELHQDTEFPAADTVKLTLKAAQPVRYTLALRVPSWCNGPATVSLNGRPLTTGTPGEWLKLNRDWRPGDEVLLTVPQKLHFDVIDNMNPDRVALMYGPLQYVLLNPPEGFPKIPPLHQFSKAGRQTFTAPGGLTFVPFYLSYNDLYSSYFTRS